jgi:hypothetical protein
MGCSADENDPRVVPALKGRYTATTAGPWTVITFDRGLYALRTSACDRDVCLEFGEFSVNREGTELSLRSETERAPRTMGIELQAAAAPSARPGLRSQSTRQTAELVDPRDSALVTPPTADNLTMEGGQALVLAAVGCVITTQIRGDHEAYLASARAKAAKEGVKITGDTHSGTLSGQIAGTYSVTGNTLHIRVTELPFIGSCGDVRLVLLSSSPT